MVSEGKAIQLMQDSVNSLQRIGMLEQEVNLNGGTVLLGTGSPLDSIALVTFVTDLEDRLSRETNQEVFLVFSDFHEFNADNPFLSVGTFARYIVNLTRQQDGSHG